MTTVAIDFGTSNTVVSIIEPDTKPIKSIRLGEISRIFKIKGKDNSIREVPVIPSLVFVQQEDNLILGEKVRIQRLGCSKPERFFKAFKRNFTAEYPSSPKIIDGKEYSSETILVERGAIAHLE